MTKMSNTTPYENPQNYNVFAVECPSRKLLTDATRRWSILVLSALLAKPLRFGELRHEIEGISDRMLSQTLVLLVDDKLVSRTCDPDTPVYSLTEPGKIMANQANELFTAIYKALDNMPQEDMPKHAE